MEYTDTIHAFVDAHKDEMIRALKELVRIPSYRTEAAENAPFGEGCAKVLAACEALFRENGFAVSPDHEGGYLLAAYGDGDTSIGVFSHADVVAPGENWHDGAPFEPTEKDGFLIGRGVMDDKSAVVASLFAMKAIRELRLPVKSRIVSFVGAGEETGMDDLDAFLSKHPRPDFSLVPDSGFPLYRGDKGRVLLEATARTRLHDILDFSGGQSVNIILGSAAVKLNNSGHTFDFLLQSTPANIAVKAENDTLILTATGISAHASMPEGSLNAGYVLTAFLAQCPALCEHDRAVMETLSRWLGDPYGAALGIDSTDPDFGKLTCANGTIRMADGKLALTFDIRYGTVTDKAAICAGAGKVFAESGFDCEVCAAFSPYAYPADDPFVRAVLETYREFTGDTDAVSLLNGGATYAHKLRNALEIGPVLWWEPPFPVLPGHGNVHQPDEMIPLDGFAGAVELLIRMLLRCDAVLSGT